MRRGLHLAAAKLVTSGHAAAELSGTAAAVTSTATHPSPYEPLQPHSYLNPPGAGFAWLPCKPPPPPPGPPRPGFRSDLYHQHRQHSSAMAAVTTAGMNLGWAAAVRGKATSAAAAAQQPTVAVDAWAAQPAAGAMGRRSSMEARRGPAQVRSRSKGGSQPIASFSAAASTAAAVVAAEKAVRNVAVRSKGKQAAGAAQQPLAEGSLVGFNNLDTQGLAVLKARKGNSWQAVDQRGMEVWLFPEDIVLRLPGGSYSPSDCGRVFKAPAGIQLRASLDELWEQLAQAGRPLPVEELAEMMYGGSAVEHQWGAFLLAVKNRTYFKQVKRKPPCFEARDAASVQQRLAYQRERSAAQSVLDGWVTLFRSGSAMPGGQKASREELLAGPLGELLAALQAYALNRETDQQREEAIQALAAIGYYANPNLAASALMDVGVMGRYQSLALMRSDISQEFPVDCLALAEQIDAHPPPDLDAARRVDLRHKKVVTIDDVSTTEIDDGVSIEWLEDGRARLWVHIADPSRFVSPGSPLDNEASRRVSTLYLPTGKISMFPSILAEGCFSLRMGEDACAMSVSAVLEADGSLSDCQIVPSTINASYRLSYTEVDELLSLVTDEEEPELFGLYEAAQRRAAYRERCGATSIDMPKSRIDVTVQDAEQPPEIKVEPEDQYVSPANMLVSEMMIMAGEVVATFCADNKIPVPFRGQAEPVLPDDAELRALPAGPCRAVAIRRCMMRSTTTTGAPGRHSGLGLNGYVQFTSPIRRYGDLLAHHQVKAFLRGEACPYSAKDLSSAMDRVMAHQQDLNRLERDVRNYWLAEYFLQRKDSATWPALFLSWMRQESGLASLLIEQLGLEIVHRVDRPAAPGDVLQLKCTQVDRLSGVYRLEEVPK